MEGLSITEEPLTTLEDYARVPIAFEVTRVYDVQHDSLGNPVLAERVLDVSYVKDYDARPEDRPTQWRARFDLSKWTLLVARDDGRRVGGAAVAFDTPGVDMLEGREDVAILWDLRVIPDARGRGVGAALFHAAESWARARGCRELRIETQNVNVPASSFYARQGCRLSAVRPGVYPTHPDEIQLIWYKDLD
jgi:GNAT superfamily N-acetyltransferase